MMFEAGGGAIERLRAPCGAVSPLEMLLEEALTVSCLHLDRGGAISPAATSSTAHVVDGRAAVESSGFRRRTPPAKGRDVGWRVESRQAMIGT
jgi:hypothetical protein